MKQILCELSCGPSKRDVCVLTPRTCECDLTFVILVDYVKDLEIDHSEFSKWTLNSMANVHVRDRRRKDR